MQFRDTVVLLLRDEFGASIELGTRHDQLIPGFEHVLSFQKCSKG